MLSLLYKDRITYSNWNADDKIITNLGCLTDNNKCFSNKQYRIKIDVKEPRQFDVRNPCIFPFKHRNKIYNSCIREIYGTNSKEFGCATSVDADLNWQTSGICNDFCPYEGIYFYRSFQSC